MLSATGFAFLSEVKWKGHIHQYHVEFPMRGFRIPAGDEHLCVILQSFLYFYSTRLACTAMLISKSPDLRHPVSFERKDICCVMYALESHDWSPVFAVSFFETGVSGTCCSIP